VEERGRTILEMSRRVLRPNSKSLAGRYSRPARVVVPARQAIYIDVSVRQPNAIVDNIPQSGTKNSASAIININI
jgi:hypothetical protein